MKKALTVLAVAGALLLGHGVASADHESPLGDPCCAKKACVDDNGDGTCDNPNGGKACNIASGGGAGCIPGLPNPAATCAGGDPSVPAGCICVAGVCTTQFLGGDCTSEAVDACCAAGACH